MHNIESTNPTEMKHQSMILHILKLSSVSALANASSLSVPIFIILVNQLDKTAQSSLEQKIIEPLFPFLLIMSCRTWLLWNFMGHRLNGQIDEHILIPDESFTQAPLPVIIGYLANIASFTNAFLVGYAMKLHHDDSFKWIPAILLGSLNYLTDLYIQVLPAFRKHVESQQTHKQHLLPFLQQRCNWLLDKYALSISTLIRELLPIVRGIIWTKATITFLETNIYPNSSFIRPLNIPLGMIIYSCSAYSTRFEIVQLRDNLIVSGKEFDTETLFSNYGLSLITMLAKASNGQLFIDGLNKLGVSTKTSVNISLVITIFVLTALQQGLFHSYLSSAETTSSNNNEPQGLLMQYILGNQKAFDLAPSIEIALLCIATILSITATYAKSAIIHQYALHRTSARIQPIIEESSDVELFSPPSA